jgi:hypothetical protein
MQGVQEFQFHVCHHKRIGTRGRVAIEAELGQASGQVPEGVLGSATVDGSVEEHDQVQAARQRRTESTANSKLQRNMYPRRCNSARRNYIFEDDRNKFRPVGSTHFTPHCEHAVDKLRFCF